MKRLLFYIISFSVLVSFFSCTDDEFTSDSSCHLSYSVDTLNFDRVLSDMITPSKTIKIYNNSGENIRIDKILKLGSEEAFQLNINGKSSTSESNLELFSGDSLYVFVQCVSSEASDILLDSIAISYNGNTDKIILFGVSASPYVLKDVVIEKDTVLGGEHPYLVYGTLTVAEGATLTIRDSVEFLFHNGAKVDIFGSLKVEGSRNRVSMRYFRQDGMTSSIPYFCVPGSWKGVYVKKTCPELELFGVDIIGGEYGIVIDSTANEKPFYIGNTTIQNNKYGALVIEDAFVYSFNSLFANGGVYNVRLIGGTYLFNHCTIASYFNHGPVRHPALSLSDRENDENIIPLKVEINNSIVYGTKESELYSESTPFSQLPTETFEFGLYYSLVKCRTVHDDDDKYYIKNKWNENLKYNIDASRYFADFHIDSLSVARTMADPMLCRDRVELSADIEGKSRIDNSYPDAGAYEY
ncbi:MAG: hypothetical protein MJZ19_07540 [Paludibacteraceae bacterium]|nr:hypothetical protein [Paludibacteraceae bacterium]